MHGDLCDPRAWTDAKVLYDLAAVHERIPQRHEMGLLHGVLHHDPAQRLAIGFHQSTPDDFWVRGHIPGRPLMPGVVMVEVAAQLCSFLGTFDLPTGPGHFMGFGGIDHTRFRGQVKPGDRMIVAARLDRLRRNLGTFSAQAWVGGDPVYDGQILGVVV